jgi:hypothetical protein
MATRMQQRRGTAAQWTSANPVLNAGEMGWESDTNKFKIGDGTNHWASIDYFADINSTVNPAFGSSITFEGATANDFETTLAITDPTADRTITIPDVTGTVITTGNLSDITNIGVFTSTITMEGSTANDFELTISAGDPTADRTATFPDATGTIVLDSATQTLTNKTIAFGSNTVSGTLAEFNTAVTDANLVSLDGSETLTNKTLTSPVISTIVNSGTLTLPTSTGTIALTTDIPAGVVTESGTQTLTNKTLTSPVVSGLTLSDSSIIIEGSTANDFETTLTVTDPTADRTITFPDQTGTVALTSYVDSVAEGLHIHASVVAATTTNITLATDVENGDTLDGVTLATGNRILVKNQSTESENGIYVVAASGAPSRATDFDSPSEIDGGDFVFVTGGTSNDNTGWVQTNIVGTVGTDAIYFSQFSGAGTYSAGTGLTLTGSVFSINTGTTVDLSTSQSLSNKTLASAVATTALTLNATAELRLADTDSSHYVGFKSPGTVAANKVWVLPAADGTAGQALSTDGSGNLSWATSGGGAAFSEFMLIGA